MEIKSKVIDGFVTLSEEIFIFLVTMYYNLFLFRPKERESFYQQKNSDGSSHRADRVMKNTLRYCCLHLSQKTHDYIPDRIVLLKEYY